MLSLLKKSKQHGVRGTIKIITQKSSVFLYNLKIRKGYYSFINNDNFLTYNSNKLVNQLNKHKFNNEVKLAIKPNDDLLLNNNYFLLGNYYHLNEPINWHFRTDDSSKSYPIDFSNKLKIMNFKKYGDYRITWELNRHHQFVWNAQNYYLKAKTQYLEKILTDINDWIDSNEIGYGVNLLSSMEIAIRLSNWFVAFIILSQKNDIKNIINSKIINSVLGQILYLNDNLFIKRKYKNNHSIVELANLILYQSLLNLKKVEDVKVLYGWLFDELDDQFYSDGLNFEHSITYSRFTIESLLILLVFDKNEALHKEKLKLNKLVHKYVTSLRRFLTPNNSVPLFSDCDNGRMLFLSGTNKDFNDFRGFFDFCAIHFNDDSLFVSKTKKELNEETKWWCYFDNKDLRVPEEINEENNSSFFNDGGYYINKSDDIFLVFKANYPGNTKLNNEYAPHVHNDILSFEMFLNGQPFLVDSGTYTYNQADGNYREYFRSAYAHNTIIINEKPQFDYYEFFGARNFPSVEIHKQGGNKVEGKIFNKDGTEITRNICVFDDRIEIQDKIEKLRDKSKIEINLNFDSKVVIEEIDNNAKHILCNIDKNQYEISFDIERNTQLEIKKISGWISDYYNCKVKNDKIIFAFKDVENKLVFNWNIKTKKI